MSRYVFVHYNYFPIIFYEIYSKENNLTGNVRTLTGNLPPLEHLMIDSFILILSIWEAYMLQFFFSSIWCNSCFALLFSMCDCYPNNLQTFAMSICIRERCIFIHERMTNHYFNGINFFINIVAILLESGKLRIVKI